MNYQTCSVEDILNHIGHSTPEAVNRMLSYYRRCGNTEVVNKIILAKKLHNLEKQYNLVAEIETAITEADEGLFLSDEELAALKSKWLKQLNKD